MSAENKYPGLPRELDRRRVLTEREISEMRDLRNQGLSSRAIAANYAVSKTIVLYWTNDEAYREKVNAKRYEAIAACKFTFTFRMFSLKKGEWIELYTI